MRKVIKHGKYYQGRETDGIPYVKCPECGTRLFYCFGFPMFMVCKCECQFNFEEEDLEFFEWED